MLAAQPREAASLLVGAGCGAFLVPELLSAGARALDYGRDIAPLAPAAAPGVVRWAGVCAPAIAVTALLAEDER